MMEPNKVIVPDTKECKQCGKQYSKKYAESRNYWERKVYCSPYCRVQSTIGSSPWNVGIKVDREKYPTMGHFQKHTPEALRKLTEANRRNAKKHPREFFVENQKLAIKSGLARDSYGGDKPYRRGELNPNWLGENAGYSSKHKWIQKHWLKTGMCQECNKATERFGRRKWGTEWHNLDGKYDREDKSTWVEVCPKCHHDLEKLWIIEKKITI